MQIDLETVEQEAQAATETPSACSRCGGLLIVEYTTDLEDSSECLWLPIWRCISCGGMMEARIRFHQAVQKANPRFAARWRSKARRNYKAVRLGV